MEAGAFVAGGVTNAAEPKDCKECFTITFLKNGTLSGKSSTNVLAGQFVVQRNSITIINLGGTEINETEYGTKFIEALLACKSFAIEDKLLKIFYVIKLLHCNMQ